jgi:thymidylate kinase
MTMATGGASFALVGADGSGKSTVAAELSSWLGWKVDARVHYLGSKPPSRASRWTYLAFRASRRGVRAASESFGEGTLVVRAAAGTRDTALAAHYLATARQRAHEYAAASRDTADGRVVVFDRFPLTRVAEIPRHDLVDGPRIAATVDSPGGPVMRRLAAAEQRIYQGFRPPTAMVVLDVDPEVATARKPDHDHDTVAAKARVLSFVSRTLAVPGSRVRTVDADRPLDDVLHDVKTELWHAL